MRAMDWVANHMELATPEQRAKIDFMRAQTARLSSEPTDRGEDGVEIINDAPKESGEDIGHSDTEVPADL